ncbi:MAG: hypothetical protein WCI23_07660 [Chlorobiaceae bacterium]
MQEKPRKKLGFLVARVVLLVIGISLLINQPVKADKGKVSSSSFASSSFAGSYSSASSSTASSSTAQEVSAGNVSYGEYTSRTSGSDELVVKTASIRSSGPIGFGILYTGDNYGHLTVRKTKHATEVIFSVDKGKLNSDHQGSVIKVTFDQYKTLSFSGSVTSKECSSNIVLTDTKFFLQALKNTKKLIVEVEFITGGKKRCEFDVSAFDLSKIGF